MLKRKPHTPNSVRLRLNCLPHKHFAVLLGSGSEFFLMHNQATFTQGTHTRFRQRFNSPFVSAWSYDHEGMLPQLN